MAGPEIKVWPSIWPDYKLLDSGNLQKLEQIGDFIIVRSEPRAWWQPDTPIENWPQPAASYLLDMGSEWVFHSPIPKEMEVRFEDLRAKVKFTKTSKHIGIFPEQSGQWQWIKKKISAEKRSINVLNLFGYTGMATLAAASAGANVTHVDGSKIAMTWARENQDLSGLSQKPVRWILDDAVKFVRREIKRGKKYDCVILDPPAFGRGPQGQVWKIEQDLPELLADCRKLLSDDPLFVILTAYAIDSSSLSIANLVTDLMQGYNGRVEAGELAIRHELSGKLLPMSIYSLWEKQAK